MKYWRLLNSIIINRSQLLLYTRYHFWHWAKLGTHFINGTKVKLFLINWKSVCFWFSFETNSKRRLFRPIFYDFLVRRRLCCDRPVNFPFKNTDASHFSEFYIDYWFKHFDRWHWHVLIRFLPEIYAWFTRDVLAQSTRWGIKWFSSIESMPAFHYFDIRNIFPNKCDWIAKWAELKCLSETKCHWMLQWIGGGLNVENFRNKFNRWIPNGKMQWMRKNKISIAFVFFFSVANGDIHKWHLGIFPHKFKPNARNLSKWFVFVSSNVFGANWILPKWRR